MVGARKQTFSQPGRDAQPHRGLHWKKSRERKKGGAAPSRACGARERSFWSTEGTDYLDERLGRLSETVEVPHSSSVSDSSFLRRAFVEATSSIASLLGVSSFEPCLCLGSAIRSEAASSSSVMPRALHNLTGTSWCKCGFWQSS